MKPTKKTPPSRPDAGIPGCGCDDCVEMRRLSTASKEKEEK